MAEIKIRKKRPVWPWVLLILLIIAALLYFFFFSGNLNNGTDDSEYSNDTISSQMDSTNYDGSTYNDMDRTNNWDSTGTNQDSLTNYATVFSEDIKSGPDFNIEAKNINRAFINLIDAVRAKALQQRVELGEELKQARGQALSMASSAGNTSSEFAKNTANSISNSLEKIQQEKYPNLSSTIQEVKSSANQIEAGKDIQNQNHKINSFFNRAVDALSKMN